MTIDTVLFLSVPATIAMVEAVLALNFKAVLAAWMVQVKASGALFRDPNLSDDEKQEKMAKASGAMLFGSLKLLFIMTLSLAVYFAVIWILTKIWADTNPVQTVLRLEFQLASLGVAIVYLWGRRRVIG